VSAQVALPQVSTSRNSLPGGWFRQVIPWWPVIVDL